MADFQRFAPEARAHLKKGPGLWVKLRLDPVILVLVMVIMAFGLMVLYSGSGASEAAINKQLIRYGAALFAMIFVTQISLRNIQRWAPLGYLLGLAGTLAILALVAGYGFSSMGKATYVLDDLKPKLIGAALAGVGGFIIFEELEGVALTMAGLG